MLLEGAMGHGTHRSKSSRPVSSRPRSASRDPHRPSRHEEARPGAVWLHHWPDPVSCASLLVVMTSFRKTMTGSGTAVVIVLALVSSGCSSSPPTSAAPSRSAVPATTATIATGAPVPSSGCATAPSAAVTNERQDIEVAGAARWYLLTTPDPSTSSPSLHKPTASTTSTTPDPRPLVVDFHGLAEGAVIHSTTSQFGVLGQTDGFVVAFPNGTGSPVQWNTTDQASSNPDLQFVSAMLDQFGVKSLH